MPPEASSRSRTYFPNTWGNTRVLHRTVLCAASLACACTTVPGPAREHLVRAHWLATCAPVPGGARVEFDLEALGDFPPSAETHEALQESPTGTSLVVPPRTRAVTIDATDGFDRFLGTGATSGDGNVDVTLWPAGRPCTLADGSASDYPGGSTAQGVGVAPSRGLLLVVGGDGGGSPVATGALTADVTTGLVTSVPAARGPHVRRAGATVTPFGDDLLVSGGYDPVKGGAALASAEVFDTGAMAFDPAVLALEQPRSGHAAVTLSSGETLVVGGMDDTGRPLASLVAIAPETRQYRISGLSDLRAPRVRPVALRLSDDRILIASGTDSGSSDAAPVDTLEWLSSDGSRVVHEASFSEAPTHVVGAAAAPRALGRAFVDMPGGSALAVGGCTRIGASECSPSPDVFWITAAGRIDLLPDPLDVDASRAELVRGEEGRPWLLATAVDGSRVFRRFDPWLGRFVTPSAPEAPADPTARLVSVDPGLFVWLGATGATGAKAVTGFRHGTRGAYSQTVAPLLLVDTTGIALDRALGSGDAGPRGDAFRAPSTGDVVLAAPDATLVITDTTYADLSVTVEVREGLPPAVFLGGTALGGRECPWPVRAPSTPYDATVVRAGDRVRLEVAGKTRECGGPVGRVSVAVRPGSGPVTVHQVVVSRGGT